MASLAMAPAGHPMSCLLPRHVIGHRLICWLLLSLVSASLLSLDLNPRHLSPLISPPQFMSCCGHVRIVDGLVYFRYGGFFVKWYRILRFVQSIKAIKVGWQCLLGMPPVAQTQSEFS